MTETSILKRWRILSDQNKFLTTTVKDDDFKNFITSQQKLIYKFYKNLVDSNCMSKETQRHVKALGTRPGISYGSCKVHKKCVHGCSPFRTILSALQTPTNKLGKFLVPILKL